MKLNELIRDERLLKAVTKMGFEEPTPIQEQGIPLIRQGSDVIARSQTGTGKTATFAIPIIEKVDESNPQVQVLVLCPTRELAVQVAAEFRKLLAYSQGIKTLAVYGGEPIYKQIAALKKGVQIIVGTPGRLMDHMKRKTVRFDCLHTVIMDEADEMLKMGFREDIETILDAIDHRTQRLLFSATMPPAIVSLADKYLEQPEQLTIKATNITTTTVLQQYCPVKKKYKTQALYRFLDAKAPERCLIFCNTKRMVDELTDNLQEKGFWSDKIHGDLKQELRMAVLNKFNQGILHILVATDVAARGLDIQDVDLVINYDVPDKEDYYVHRIGRSGRAGKTGEAITIVANSDRRNLRNIEYYIKKQLEPIAVPSGKDVYELQTERFIEKLMLNMNQSVLDDYQVIIDRIQQKGYSMPFIAAALLKDAISLHEIADEVDINDYLFGKNKKSKQSGNGNKQANKRTNRKPIAKRDDRFSRGQTRLFISVGKKHKVNVGDLLGAILGECRVDAKHIGAIDMYDKFSFVDVDDKKVEKVIRRLMGKRIKGRKVNIEVSSH